MIAEAVALRAELPGERPGRAAEAIKRVEVTASESVLDLLHLDRPSRGFEGRFSVRFCVAAALLDGEVGLDSFGDEALAREDLRTLMGRVVVHSRPERVATAHGDRRIHLTVHTRSGVRLERDTDGTVPRPASHEAVVAKYRRCAGRAVSAERVEASLRMLERLEETTVAELVDVVSGEEEEER